MKILRNERGSVTLFVLIAMLFFLMYMVGLYIMSANSESSQIAETARIKEIYEEGTNNIDDVYATLESHSNTYNLPENGPDIENGTQVKKPQDKDWDETKINSYSDGKENTIPVPVGFSPISESDGQGTQNTGFVIKDITTDENGEPSKTYGNEFVWIPCTIDGSGNSIKYDRYVFGSYDNNSYSETLPEDEKSSIEKYGGYYIGRYEAGIEGGKLTSTTRDGTKEWTGYTDGKLVIQKGKQSWNYITKDRALLEASNLYNIENNNVKSKLCSSYAWDTALKFIESNSDNLGYATNSVQGNYSDISFLYEDLSGTTRRKEIDIGLQVPTGQTTPVNNIYDMGGNIEEWTTETFKWRRL